MMVQELNSLRQGKQYTYTSSGKPYTVTTYDGTVFTSTYDMNNNLSSVTYNDDIAVRVKQFTYDPITHMVTSVEDFVSGVGQGSIQYKHTKDGKLSSIIYLDGKQYVINYIPSTDK